MPNSAHLKRRRILVAHGFHPGEVGMRKLYEELIKLPPIEGVDHMIIAPKEWAEGRRLLNGTENLAMALPNPVGSHGQRIIANYCNKIKDYDIAINPHGNPMPDGGLVFYGPKALQLVHDTAGFFGFHNAIVRSHGVEMITSNTITLEITPTSPVSKAAEFHKKLQLLAAGNELPRAKQKLFIYAADVTLKTSQLLNLQSKHKSLEPLNQSDNAKLCKLLKTPGITLYAYAWDKTFFPDKVYQGELLTDYPLPSGVYIPNDHSL
jgi:hypothetical protein